MARSGEVQLHEWKKDLKSGETKMTHGYINRNEASVGKIRFYLKKLVSDLYREIELNLDSLEIGVTENT